MPSSSRNTEIASLLESFLDTNEDNLPPAMFSELDALAGEIDSLVKDKDEEINDLKVDNEDLKNQIEVLEEK